MAASEGQTAGPRVLVAQIGARRHYAVATALSRTNQLECMFTDIDSRAAPWRWLGLAMSAGLDSRILRKLAGRIAPHVPAQRVVGMSLVDLLMYRLGSIGGTSTDRWSARNAAFCRWVVRYGFGSADTVYAFNGAALEIFLEARAKGLRTVLDQTAAPWRWNARLLSEEIRKWNGWEDEPAELDASGALTKREEAEWALADMIICGSTFCLSTLIDSGVSALKCHVLQYPPDSNEVPVRERRASEERMRVLFVGTLQLRKGVQYLYQVAERLSAQGNVEFRLVGPSLLSDGAQRKLTTYFDVRGPVPRSQMAEHYSWADVLVTPTLSEGSANVCHEAMAAGLPVITTRAAGSPVRDKVDGLIVPERDVGALTDAISYMAGNPEIRRRFGDSARAYVDASRRADVYTKSLSALLADVDSETNEGSTAVSCG